MSDYDNDGQMIFGDLGGLKLPDICLTGEEKASPRKPVPTGDRTGARYMTDAHATAWPTAVDCTFKNYVNNTKTNQLKCYALCAEHNKIKLYDLIRVCH